MLRLAVTALLFAGLAGCTDGQTTAKPEPTATVGDDGLTVTRDGGDTYEFHDAVAECITSEAGDGSVEVVRITAPADYKRAFRNGKLREPFLWVEVIPGVEGRQELPLKVRNFDEGPPDITVFGGDPRGQNELSGSVEVASGSLTVIEATCDPEPRLAFTMRATLGSEFSNGRSVHVSGGLEAGEHPD